MATLSVKLGKNTYEVVPQKRAKLKRKIGKEFDALAGMALDTTKGGIAGAVIDAVGEGSHRLLSVFIPDLMDEWEWEGFGSQGAYDRTMADDDVDEYDETGDNSPDHDQIVTAFEVVIRANRFDVVKALGQFVDPSMIRGLITNAVAGLVLGDDSPTGSLTSSSSASASRWETSPTSPITDLETPPSD